MREFVRAAMFGRRHRARPWRPSPRRAAPCWSTAGWRRRSAKELAQHPQPTLIVHPREDDLADLNNAWHLQRHLRGLVNTVVLDDSYHIVTIDRQRQLVVDRVTAFVERAMRRASGASVRAVGKGMDVLVDG